MIRFERLVKRFGDHLAVDDVTLRLRAGEVVALLGPNGSGKTTCLKCAAGLIRPTSGEVLLGVPGRPASEPHARRVLSFLPQKVAFPEPLTGRELLELYRRLRGVPAERVEEVLRIAALTAAADRAVGTYSGGMIQRLGLAVATLPDAPVLLMDEPTSALDQAGVEAFYRIAEERRARGRAVVFSSHQLDDVERLADRVAILVAGRLVADFTRAELTERLAERGVLRVRFSGHANGLMKELGTLAPGAATLEGAEIAIRGAAGVRAAALQAIRGSGVEIRALVAQEGRLDELYREVSEGRT